MSGSLVSERLLPRGRGWLRLTAISVVGVALVVAAYLLREDEFSDAPGLHYTAGGDAADEGYRPRKVLADALPPITKVPLLTAAGADKVLDPAELVLGVTVGHEARAYPINMLTGPRREIINDQLGGRAIAATW